MNAPAVTWREAVHAAGELSTGTGVAGSPYTEAMIRVVEDHGPYIVIAPGFALAHSRPDESVTRTGMSLVRLATPVKFGHPVNDPVRLVMGLASVDSSSHRAALAALAEVLGDVARRDVLERATSPEAIRGALDMDVPVPDSSCQVAGSAADRPAAKAIGLVNVPSTASPVTSHHEMATVPSKNMFLTVCGNGLGTSLFLANTAEQVLERWGWGSYLTVEATDTISARGRAKEADFMLTSGAIADTLGDVGVPVEVIQNFTSQAEIDDALRRRYAV